MTVSRIVSFTVMLLLLRASILTAQDAASLAAIREGRTLTASVRVGAFDSNGHVLGNADIRHFEALDGGKDWAAKFREGKADGIPYGAYRIEARLTAYSADSRIVRIYQRQVMVVVGLTVSNELPAIPPNLPGRVTGPVPVEAFVRLTGLYANASIDSSIDAGGHFDLGGLSEGKYLLMVIGSSGILGSRQIAIPYVGPPLQVEVASKP